ncbi:MAG: tripartite tricarboxylate transporter substrate binding protein [Burkholderiaceae bacterium]|nr:tripartite tricarboxylate transporter substrate binding protein [Burkholderiaceae bacterium]
MRRPRLIRTVAALLLSAAAVAQAAFPDKPLKLIVPFPAGGAADVMARGMAQRLGVELGQTIVIDNRGGAGGQTAAEAVTKSPADGYTLFFATMGTLAINPAIYPKLRYDPVKDFAPISLTHVTPRVLVVGPSVAATDLAGLIAEARKRPDALSYGSAGNGSSSHLSGALFEALADVKMLHVPYKGSAPLLTDVLAGRVDMTFDSYTVYEEHIRAGKVRALGVTSPQRMAALPQVPAIAEAGLKGYDVSNWLGVLAPAGTPQAVLDTLHTALGRAMADPALRQQLQALGIEPKFGTQEAFGQLIRSDIVRWAEIVKRSGANAN